MSTIEGMISTNDRDIYQSLRMLRGHGMLREVMTKIIKDFVSKHPDLNKDFIFLYNSFNVRNTEIGGLLVFHN